MTTPDDTALADRLEALANAAQLEHTGHRWVRCEADDVLLAARRLRELGAEVERLNGEIAVLREAAGANNDPEFWLIRIRLGNDLLYETEVKVEAVEARIAELEAERAWRPEDYVLVPKEPTYQMCEAGGFFWEGGSSEAFPRRWRAMLAAAPPLPTAPTERGTEEG